MEILADFGQLWHTPGPVVWLAFPFFHINIMLSNIKFFLYSSCIVERNRLKYNCKPTCGIWVVLPLPVSPIIIAVLNFCTSRMSMVLAGNIGSALRSPCSLSYGVTPGNRTHLITIQTAWCSYGHFTFIVTFLPYDYLPNWKKLNFTSNHWWKYKS